MMMGTPVYCKGPRTPDAGATRRGGGHEPLKSISLSLEAALCRAASTPGAPRLLVTSRRLAPFLPVADHSTPPASIVVAHPEDAPPRPTTATAPAPATSSVTSAPAETNAPRSARVLARPPVSALCRSSALGSMSSRGARDERRRAWPASYLMRDAIRGHQWQSAHDERRGVWPASYQTSRSTMNRRASSRVASVLRRGTCVSARVCSSLASRR